MTDFQPKRGDRTRLLPQELETLDMKVLPTARRWMEEYPVGSSLWNHAKGTLVHWNEVQP